MEPGCALAMFTWVSCMHFKIYICIFLRDESHGTGTLRGLREALHRLGESFTPGIPLSSAQPLSSHQQGCPAPHHERVEGLLAPCQTYKRLSKWYQRFLTNSLDIYFGSNSACVLHFTFILNYALISGGNQEKLFFFPPPGQYDVGGVLLSVKENNP